MKEKSFTAKLQKSENRGAWTHVIPPFDSGKFFGSYGLVKVTGTIDGHPFSGSLMATGNHVHMLPINAEVRKAIGKEAPQSVKVTLRIVE